MQNSETIQLDDDVAVELAGHHDAVLDALRERAGCAISMRGNEITLGGDAHAIERGRAMVQQLVEIFEGGTSLTPDMVGVVEADENEAEHARATSGAQVAAATGKGRTGAGPGSQAASKATGPARDHGQRPSAKEVFTDVVLTHRGKPIGPRSTGQKRYVDAIRENSITFGIGPAGTGKTYLAMAMAVDALVERRVARIILCRPAVEAGEKLGFLPGGMLDKVDPYLRPLYDALYDMMDPDRLTTCMEQGIIEVAPLAYMRGRTLNDAFVVLDEAQNTSPEQMQMFLTRLGFGSKMVVTGDPTQVDLQRGQKSGLEHVNRILRGIEDIAFAQFDQADVQRHRLVQRIVAAYSDAKEIEVAEGNA
ncbi:MAG: Phosphate starvation-inducible protein PhoH [Thermoleophilia bacterium]|nr:Phosphate starvation-inducible protein PhoH [Thermoleophilia bacterium]